MKASARPAKAANMSTTPRPMSTASFCVAGSTTCRFAPASRIVFNLNYRAFFKGLS